ncbi:zinc finger domain-containing protein [Streptomyces diastatochromogenes]
MPQLAEPAAAVEQFDCPTCEVPAGSTCRTRGGKVAPKYHAPRFVLVPQLRAELEVRVGGGPSRAGRPQARGRRLRSSPGGTTVVAAVRAAAAHRLCGRTAHDGGR